MRLVNVQQMLSLEAEANQEGLSYAAMMAKAGLGLAQLVHQRYFFRKARSILGLVGSGNNGGDTLIALAHLANWGWRTHAFLLKDRPGDDDALGAYKKGGGEIITLTDKQALASLRELALSCDYILDGILGTGINQPLKGEAKRVLQMLSALPDHAPVIAVDCPSGVDCDNGSAAIECLRADLTVCMAAVKQGLLQQPALELAGEITAVEIGLPKNLDAWREVSETQVMEAAMVAALLPPRPPDAHKGSFGTCLIAAGCVNYCGAVLLAAEAAYRSGVGLVRAAIPAAIYDALAGHLPEITWLLLPHTQGVFNGEGAKILMENLASVDSLLLGPGWGIENETLDFLRKLLKGAQGNQGQNQMGFNAVPKEKLKVMRLPKLVIDADALKLLAQIEGWEKMLGGQAVLTPHPGEMSILTGLTVKEIQSRRQEIAGEYARRWGQVVVLKGALTVIADGAGRCTLVPVADAALATAGSGDVLAGVIAALLAGGMQAYEAAQSGAWLHARAGQLAAKWLGNRASVMTGDILRALPEAISQIGGQ